MIKSSKVPGGIIILFSILILSVILVRIESGRRYAQQTNKLTGAEKTVFVSDPRFHSQQSGKLAVLDDISDKRVGIITGTVYDAFITNKYPNAQVYRFESLPFMTLALKTNKIDAAMLDRITAALVLKNNPDLGLLTDQVQEMPLGVGFNKNNTQLLKEFNEFLDEIKKDGTLNKMSERWLVRDAEEAEIPEFKEISSGKKLVAGVSVDNLPYVGMKNQQYVGFDIELLRRFAERCNYELEIITVEYSDLLAFVYSGKVDLIATGIAVSEKRSSQINFSSEYTTSLTSVIAPGNILAGYARTEAEIHQKPFLKRTISIIYNNLIRDDMYKVILKGLWITILISVLSAVLGIIIGILICALYMSKDKALRWFARTYIMILRGIPLVVLLLVCYYVIFASVNINPVVVAIIAFGVNSGAFVSVMLKTSIESINKGQIEACLASGFTRMQSYIHIILPQLLRRILPVYKSEFVAIIKMTSIVGFIAVEDLTKASDIIRSRTLDAYFPLILTAVIYFIITMLLISALGYIEIKIDPKRRRYRFKKILEQ